MREGQFKAGLLRSSARSYASGILEKQEELTGRAPEPFGQWMRDTELQLLQLAEALAVDRPRLMARQLEWLKVLWCARGGGDYEELKAHFQAMHAALGESLPAPHGKEVATFLAEALRDLDAAPEEHPTFLPEGPAGEVAKRWLLAALELRRHDAIRVILEAADGGMSIVALREEVLRPAQAEAGRLWHLGQLHAGEEHFLTELTQHVMTLLEERDEPEATNGYRVLAGGVGGDLHGLGIRLVADALRHAGYECILLGPNMPAPDLAASVRDFQPDLLALSTHLLLHVSMTREAIAQLRAELGEECPPILVGGVPFQWVDDLWQVVGADAQAHSSAGAVEAVRTLLSGHAPRSRPL